MTVYTSIYALYCRTLKSSILHGFGYEFDGEEGVGHVGEDDDVSALLLTTQQQQLVGSVLTVRSQGLGHMLTIVPN